MSREEEERRGNESKGEEQEEEGQGYKRKGKRVEEKTVPGRGVEEGKKKRRGQERRRGEEEERKVEKQRSRTEGEERDERGLASLSSFIFAQAVRFSNMTTPCKAVQTDLPHPQEVPKASQCGPKTAHVGTVGYHGKKWCPCNNTMLGMSAHDRWDCIVVRGACMFAYHN